MSRKVNIGILHQPTESGCGSGGLGVDCDQLRSDAEFSRRYEQTPFVYKIAGGIAFLEKVPNRYRTTNDGDDMQMTELIV